MEEYIKKYSKNSIVISILLIIFSIFLMVRPYESVNLIIMLFGGAVAIDGIIHIISYFKVPNEYRIFNFELLEGVLQIIFGLIAIFSPFSISGLFPILIGVWIILSSIVKFQLSLNLRHINGSNWIMLLVLSIITFILGILMIVNPLSSVVTITTIAGILLFVSEVINVIEYIFILVKIK